MDAGSVINNSLCPWVGGTWDRRVVSGATGKGAACADGIRAIATARPVNPTDPCAIRGKTPKLVIEGNTAISVEEEIGCLKA
jgi:hypothetical protein